MSEGTFAILVLGLGGLAALYFLAVRPLIDFMLRIIQGKENLNKLEIKERVIQTLKEMNCNPDEINENEDGNDAIIFNFQDQNFIIYVDGSPLVRIYCTWWAKLDLNVGNIPILKEAINEYNLYHCITTVYTVDKENNLIGVHCKHALNFQEVNGDYEDMLRAYLSFFFSTQRELRERFNKLKSIKHDKPKRQIIKGFN